MVSSIALEKFYADWFFFIKFASATRLFARMDTDTSQSSGEWHFFSYNSLCLTVFTLGNKIYVTWYIDMSWTSLATGHYITFPLCNVMISGFSINQCTSGANLNARE